MELGELIKKRRIKHGLSLRDVSRLTGIPFQTIHRIERGTVAEGDVRSSTVTVLRRWAGK